MSAEREKAPGSKTVSRHSRIALHACAGMQVVVAQKEGENRTRELGQSSQDEPTEHALRRAILDQYHAAMGTIDAELSSHRASGSHSGGPCASRACVPFPRSRGFELSYCDAGKKNGTLKHISCRHMRCLRIQGKR